ncbi:MAG: mitochondrial fission ELM1 family protein [Alphaproteobacteria bacterium]|jgi:mitochondrial fission protein ELM1|nr:mitochondrial fission ELM1 family protein [Alphaproteobacteria bacterium]
MKIIAIHDGNSGHISQLNGVLSGFNNDSTEIITAKKSFLNYLPETLLERFLFTLNKDLKSYTEPQLIIAVGRKSLPYAVSLKKTYPKAKLVFLMPVGKLSQKYGDLIFYHSYKEKKYNDPKYIPIISAPHNLSQEKLDISLKDWQETFIKFNKPIITVVIGGSAKKIQLNKEAIDDLLEYLYKIQLSTGGSLFITTSRRTGEDNENYLKTKLQSLIAEDKCYFWGYHNNSGKNPYLAMLAVSNYVIISGESISMISESCSLSQNVGVYIFFSKNFYANRYIKFHENLYLHNYAKPLAEFTLETKRETLNITNFVINKIKEIL